MKRFIHFLICQDYLKTIIAIMYSGSIVQTNLSLRNYELRFFYAFFEILNRGSLVQFAQLTGYWKLEQWHEILFCK